MTLACPSYSETIPHPECEPYKKVIRTLVDTVRAKDEAITKLQEQATHKDAEVEKVTKVAEHAGGTDIETILVSVGAGLVGGFILGKVIK